MRIFAGCCKLTCIFIPTPKHMHAYLNVPTQAHGVLNDLTLLFRAQIPDWCVSMTDYDVY